MLEHYYVKPSTIDRIRVSWLGSQIENYVGWVEANGYFFPHRISSVATAFLLC